MDLSRITLCFAVKSTNQLVLAPLYIYYQYIWLSMLARAPMRQNKSPKKGLQNSKKNQNKQSNAKTSGFVRIISGVWKGKKLPVQDVLGLRPTTDRVKETVFNWLMFDIANRNTLDCFAGSGSLGFEALSRGASKLTLLEKNKSAATILQKNANSLNANDCSVYHTDSLNYLDKCQEKFDLIFIDPPFRCGLAKPTIDLLIKNELLKPDTLVYLEIESELSEQIWPDTWQVLKEKEAGQVSYRLFLVA